MKITQNTLIPISSLVLVASAVGYISMAYSEIKHNAEAIKTLQTERIETHKKLDDIIQRLSRIEGKMEKN